MRVATLTFKEDRCLSLVRFSESLGGANANRIMWNWKMRSSEEPHRRMRIQIIS